MQSIQFNVTDCGVLFQSSCSLSQSGNHTHTNPLKSFDMALDKLCSTHPSSSDKSHTQIFTWEQLLLTFFFSFLLTLVIGLHQRAIIFDESTAELHRQNHRKEKFLISMYSNIFHRQISLTWQTNQMKPVDAKEQTKLRNVK